jgi:hypothetical protein
MEISIDIWAEITKRLDIWEILNMFRLSKRHRALSERDDIWKVIFRQHYGMWSEAEFPGKTWRHAKKYIICLRTTLLGGRYTMDLKSFGALIDEHKDELYIRSSSKAMVVCNGFGREEWLREGDMEINHDPEKYGQHYRFKVRDGFALAPPLAFCWPHKSLDYCTVQGHTFLDYTKESLAACEVKPHIHSLFPERSFSSAEEVCQCRAYYDSAVSFFEIRDPRCPSLILIMKTESYETLKRLCETSLHLSHRAYFFSANPRWALLEI